MQLGFRGRLLVGITTLVVLFATAAVLGLAQLTSRFASEQVAREVDESRTSFAAQMRQRRSALQDETRLIARSPVLLATAAIEGVDQATFEAAFDEIQNAFAAPILAVVDGTGHVVARRGAELPAGDLRTRPGLDAALAGSVGDHVWTTPAGLVLVALAPLVQGDELLGVLVRGVPIDGSFAAGISALSGNDALLAHDGNLLATSWRRQQPRA